MPLLPSFPYVAGAQQRARRGVRAPGGARQRGGVPARQGERCAAAEAARHAQQRVRAGAWCSESRWRSAAEAWRVCAASVKMRARVQARGEAAQRICEAARGARHARRAVQVCACCARCAARGAGGWQRRRAGAARKSASCKNRGSAADTACAEEKRKGALCKARVQARRWARSEASAQRAVCERCARGMSTVCAVMLSYKMCAYDTPARYASEDMKESARRLIWGDHTRVMLKKYALLPAH